MAIVPTYDRLTHGNRDAADEAPERQPFISVRPHRPDDVFTCGHSPRYVIREGNIETCLGCRGEREAAQR